MNSPHKILEQLIDELQSQLTRCSIVLIGSFAAGNELPDSDIDLNIFLPGPATSVSDCPFIADDNRWQLQVKRIIDGVRIDVAWDTIEALEGRMHGDGPADCWSFSRGKILVDPEIRVRRCLSVVQAWFRAHPEIEQRYNAEYQARKQSRPNANAQHRTAQP